MGRMDVRRTTLGMPRAIGAIADKHGMDLARVGSRLVLDNPPWTPLMVRVVDTGIVLVAHLTGDATDGPTDPEATYWTPSLDYIDRRVPHPWVPLSLAQPVGQHSICGLVLCGDLVLAVPHIQRELASFAEAWAANLKEQRYIENGALRLLQHQEEDEG